MSVLQMELKIMRHPVIEAWNANNPDIRVRVYLKYGQPTFQILPEECSLSEALHLSGLLATCTMIGYELIARMEKFGHWEEADVNPKLYQQVIDTIRQKYAEAAERQKQNPNGMPF